MSQSDYIRYKRIATELKNDNKSSPNNKLLPVLEQGQLLNYKQFSLENTIINTKPILNMLTPSGTQPVFTMNRVVSGCSTFETCKNTHSRPNKVLMSSVYFTPVSLPLSIKIRNEATNLKNECISAPNTRYSQYYLCSNKLGRFGQVR